MNDVTATVQQPLVQQEIQNTQQQKPVPKKNRPVVLVLIALIVFFLGALLIDGWYFQSQLTKLNEKTTASTTATPLQTLIVGSDATAPPMESMNKEGGLSGYDIDLGYRLANEMGVKIEFRNVPWDYIFQELKDKKIDMIISSVTITDERKKLYDFSDPYINAGQIIVSRKDNPITSTAQLKGKKISVQKGTTNEKEAVKFTSPDLVMSYDDFIAATKALADGKVDAMISDLTLAKGFIGEYSNLKITSDPFTNEYYGIVVRKGDTSLLKKVNEALGVLRVKGILTDLKQKWLD